jgi:hypothetical protein
MKQKVDLIWLSKSDLKQFGLFVTDSEWDEIIINLSWVNFYTLNSIFQVMKECESYKDFILKLIDTKGTFPDSNCKTIQQKYGMYFIN